MQFLELSPVLFLFLLQSLSEVSLLLTELFLKMGHSLLVFLLLIFHLLLVPLDACIIPVCLHLVEFPKLHLLLLKQVLGSLQFFSVPLLLLCQMLSMLGVEVLQFLVLLISFFLVRVFLIFLLLDPLLLPIRLLILHICNRLLCLHHFALMLCVKLISLIQVLLLKLCFFLLFLIHLVLLLFYGLGQVFLIFLLCLCVFLDALGILIQFCLQLFALGLTFPDQFLVFGYVLLQIVEHLKLLVEGNQGVEFVLRLDIFFLAEELQFCSFLLFEQGLRETLSDNFLSDTTGEGIFKRVASC